jgi:hypothetical protein
MAARKRRAGEGTGGEGARAPAAAAEEEAAAAEEEAAAAASPAASPALPLPFPRKLFLENVLLPSPPGVFKFRICCL